MTGSSGPVNTGPGLQPYNMGAVLPEPRELIGRRIPAGRAWRRCQAEDRIRAAAAAASGMWDSRCCASHGLTRNGQILLQAAVTLHRIDCVVATLREMDLRLPGSGGELPGDATIAGVWARSLSAIQAEVLYWASAELDRGLEITRAQLEPLGFPYWWGEHSQDGQDRRDGQGERDHQASQGVGYAAPGPVAGTADNTMKENQQ